MLYVGIEGQLDVFSYGTDIKPTSACGCDCCAIPCEMCRPGQSCPHSRHGVGGMCVVKVETGSRIYQLEASLARQVLSASPPVYQEKIEDENGVDFGVYRIHESDIPSDFDLTGWHPIDGIYHCLKYYSKAPRLIRQCLCPTAEECSHKTEAEDFLSLSQAKTRPGDYLSRKRAQQLLR